MRRSIQFLVRTTAYSRRYLSLISTKIDAVQYPSMITDRLPATLEMPHLATMPISGKKRHIEKLKPNRCREAFDLLKTAERLGNNIALGEFPDMKYLQEILSMASSVSVSEPETGKMESLVIVQPYSSARSMRPTICQAFIVTRVQGRDLGVEVRDLWRVGEELARDAGCGYTGCVVEVFIQCVEHVMALREEGFLVTCVIPHSGLMSGLKGHIPSHIMYRELDTASVEDKLIPEGIRPELMLGDGLDNFLPALAPLPSYLPLTYTMQDGKQALVRPLSPGDLEPFYNLVLDASKRSEGYGIDEFPTKEYFYMWYVHDYHNIVLEEKDSGKIFAFINFGPSQFNRSKHSLYLQCGNAIVAPEFRSRKYSPDIYKILFGVAIDCGCHCMVSDTAITNKPVMTGFVSCGGMFLGSIPKAIRYEKSGWTDVLVDFVKYRDVSKSFQELINRSKI